MQGYNLIAVLDAAGTSLLFCRRTCPPYEGLLNLVGGHIEPGESGPGAAYRELEEETGISRAEIALLHLMDFTYPLDPCYVEVYAGRLRGPVILREEAHPLLWVKLEGEDFFPLDRYAGEGNIGHIVEHIKLNREKIRPIGEGEP